MSRTYKIKEFEKVSGVSAHTLRFFDKIGLLSPSRGNNGYRVYTLDQVSIAEIIVLLQKALFSNTEIKEILSDYGSDFAVAQLARNRIHLRKEIANLKRVENALGKHIDYLLRLKEIRRQLFIPFNETLPSRRIGLIRVPTNDIVDFFDAGDQIMKDPAWPFFRTHGFLLTQTDVFATGYRLDTMFVDDLRAARQASQTLPAGLYRCMFSDGSLENNPRVFEFIQQTQVEGHTVADPVVLEQVSGPVVEKRKSDFLVKICLRVADS